MSYQSLEGKKPNDFIKAFKTDLPLGSAALECVVEAGLEDKVDASIQDCTVSRTQDDAGPLIFNFPPLSAVGQQLIRLTGADVPRKILQKEYECNLYLINCCGIIATEVGYELSDEDLMAIQYDNQNGVTAHADC